MRFSQEFIDRVAEANNIIDIISQHTQLKTTGGGYMGRCPFPDHPEKTPSFSVSMQKQVYHCFGCHKKGNIYSFLQEYSGLSFPEAVEYLAERANIQLPQDDSPTATAMDAQKQKRKNLLKATQLAAQFYHDQLILSSNNEPVRKYLTQRQLQPKTVDEFLLGYAPNEWDSLEKHLHQKNIVEAISLEAKLLKQRTGSGATGSYDLFRDRLMFPIFNNTGEVVAFGGRIIQSGEPKYLNSPESPIFSKGKILYGLHLTARHLRAEDQALIVEGYMDLIALYQAGLKNVVASMGTALTLEQALLMKRYTQNVVALFDGDEAGIEAAERSLPLLLQSGCYPKGLILPEGLDPDDYLKTYGEPALRELIQSAPDLFDLVVGRWMQNYRGEATEKIQLLNRVTPILNAAAKDRRLFDLYVQNLSQKMGVTVHWLKSGLLSETKTKETSTTPPSQGPKAPAQSIIEPNLPQFSLKQAPKAELLLLSLAIKSRANFEFFLENHIDEDLTHAGIKEILLSAQNTYRQSLEKFDKFFGLLISKVDEPNKLFLSEESAASVGLGSSEIEIRFMQDCFKKIKGNKLRLDARSLVTNYKANHDPAQLEKIIDLHKRRLSIKNEETK